MKATSWIMGLIAAIFLGLLGMVASNVDARAGAAEARVNDLEKRSLEEAEIRGKTNALLENIQRDLSELKIDVKHLSSDHGRGK